MPFLEQFEMGKILQMYLRQTLQVLTLFYLGDKLACYWSINKQVHYAF